MQKTVKISRLSCVLVGLLMTLPIRKASKPPKTISPRFTKIGSHTTLNAEKDFPLERVANATPRHTEKLRMPKRLSMELTSME